MITCDNIEHAKRIFKDLKPQGSWELYSVLLKTYGRVYINGDLLVLKEYLRYGDKSEGYNKI